jgi:hypothetical protein
MCVRRAFSSLAHWFAFAHMLQPFFLLQTRDICLETTVNKSSWGDTLARRAPNGKAKLCRRQPTLSVSPPVVCPGPVETPNGTVASGGRWPFEWPTRRVPGSAARFRRISRAAQSLSTNRCPGGSDFPRGRSSLHGVSPVADLQSAVSNGLSENSTGVCVCSRKSLLPCSG